MPRAPYNPNRHLIAGMGTMPTIIDRVYTKKCGKCGAEFRTPAPNRKPLCDECKRKGGKA